MTALQHPQPPPTPKKTIQYNTIQFRDPVVTGLAVPPTNGEPGFFINRYFFYFCRLKCNQHTNVKNTMDNDLFESISQRGSVEEIAENRRIIEIADGLRRSCQIYEAELRSRQENVSRFEIEQRAAERYAKESGIWIPLRDIANLGAPGPSGNENDLYVSNDIIYKVNNLLNSGSIL